MKTLLLIAAFCIPSAAQAFSLENAYAPTVDTLEPKLSYFSNCTKQTTVNGSSTSVVVTCWPRNGSHPTFIIVEADTERNIASVEIQ